MARIRQTRKRSRPQPYRYGVKRRRMYKRRARRSAASASSTGHGSCYMPFRARRLSNARFRRALWNATTPLTKFHSSWVGAAPITTAEGSVGTMRNYATRFADRTDEDDFFFTADGGVIWPDIGGSANDIVPNNNLIVRGGTFFFEILNPDDATNDGISYQIGLVRASQQFTNASVTSVQAYPGMRIDRMPDFSRWGGKVVAWREGYLKEGEGVIMKYRNKCRKIDYYQFTQGQGPSSYFWVISVGNGWQTTSQTVRYKWGWDLSFTCDTSAA